MPPREGPRSSNDGRPSSLRGKATPEMSDYQTIRYDVVDGVATLTLHRPERRNTMSNEMLLEVGELLQKAAVDPSLRLLVLTGTGSSFCPGADIQAVASGRAATERSLGPDDF